MSVPITMPKLGLTMKTGKVSRWSRKEGDRIQKGEVLFEVETEKITNKVEAPADGILFQILVPEGATVPVGAVLAILAEPGEQLERVAADRAGAATVPPASPAAAAESGARTPRKPVERGEILATPAARRLARELGVDLALVKGSGPEGRIKEGDVSQFHEEARRRPRATPLAEEIARQAGLDLTGVVGTGEGGKITREDVEQALRRDEPVAVEETPKAVQVIPMSGMRKAIADNMLASLQNAAQLSMFTEVDVTESLRFLATVRERFKGDATVRVSMNDLLILATSRALKRFPIMNSTQTGDEIILHESVGMGIAVAVPDGLIVPVLRDADRKGLLETAREARALIEKARSGTLSMDEVTGGTFTITNLSSSRVDGFTPILRPPETGIMGAGRVIEKPVVIRGQVAIRSLMGLSLTIDHRVVDGAPASEFLGLVAEFLEEPAKILI